MANQIGVERWTVALLGAATVAAIVAPVAGRTHAWLGVLAALVAFSGAPWAAHALPSALDGVLARRRVASMLWLALALVGVLQMGRLSMFMADATREWGATVPDPAATHHACMSAYVYAAELSERRVANVYAADWYPIFDPPGPTCRLVATSVQGLAPWASDAYEYPPPFLLLPRLALAVTSSFTAIRAWWFVIQALALIGAGVLFARWVGGAAGLTLGLLLPAVLASLETMFGLQFGQFHAMAMMLALGGMVAVASRRTALAGALLAAAILSKMSPAILLVALAARRDWRALGWTAVWGAIYAGVGLAVLGPQPYVAFVTYQLPRLANGAAFAFTHTGAHPVFLASRNFSIAGIAHKLELLGAPGQAIAVASALPWIYSIALLVAAAWVARRERPRADDALLWLALLDLAALRSPEAPSFYALAPVLWLLALLATRLRGRRPAIAALAVSWVLVVGPPPLPDRVDLIVNLACQAFVFVLCAVVVWRVGAARERAPKARAIRAATATI